MIINDFSRGVDTDPVKVTAIIVHHRPLEHEFVQQAIGSLRGQAYPKLECITLHNTTGLTTGAARNAAVQQAKGQLILFLEEDDMLTSDTVASMVHLYHEAKQQLPGLVHVTTPCIALLKDGSTAMLPAHKAPGMYEREYLLNNPFDADLDHKVDAMQQVRMQNLGKLQGRPCTFAITHHFGYVLRAHPFRRDGITVNTP